ncbi:hypothetical protein V5N11_012777 [Cardamine amara subsp. amara]|uniref:Gag protein n=1 Tax=Cardamine amara subsp. amara TaxID=228776 RepID=A0ABD1BYW3_CARAN
MTTDIEMTERNNQVEETAASVIETVKVPSGNHTPPPSKFDGTSFKMWKKKMFFYLTTLNLQKYTNEVKPLLPEGNTDPCALASVHAWEHGDFLCKGYIQNSLSDQLFKVYENAETSKDLWDTLDKKYRIEDSGTQKFTVAKFMQYQMVDSRPLMEQVEELQMLLHDIYAEGMRLCETYQGCCIIEKLPPGWRDFKNYLRLKKKKMSLEDLTVRLRVESTNREQVGVGGPIRENNANMAELQNNNQGKWPNKGHLNKGKGKMPPKNTQKFKNKNG